MKYINTIYLENFHLSVLSLGINSVSIWECCDLICKLYVGIQTPFINYMNNYGCNLTLIEVVLNFDSRHDA